MYDGLSKREYIAALQAVFGQGINFNAMSRKDLETLWVRFMELNQRYNANDKKD